MNTINLIAYQRKLGKIQSKKIRYNGNVPCVIYGGAKQIYFFSPMFLFNNLIYTYNSYFINIDIEGCEYICILQNIQFHPVSNMILHADFLQIFNNRKIKIKIPINLCGKLKIENQGKIIQKIKKIRILSYPKDIPNLINVDIKDLTLKSSIKIKSLDQKKYKILCNQNLSIVMIKKIRKVTEEKESEVKK